MDRMRGSGPRDRGSNPFGSTILELVPFLEPTPFFCLYTKLCCQLAMESNSPLILTLRLDEDAQHYFDELRAAHFPAGRNFLKAHLTLFHKLPDTRFVAEALKSVNVPAFDLQVTGLMNLGAGVAYRLESTGLTDLHQTLSRRFNDLLSPQDKQGFRPHITIQNKTTPSAAKTLLTELTKDLQPFAVHAIGLDLWRYLGGPWAHKAHFVFS